MEHTGGGGFGGNTDGKPNSGFDRNRVGPGGRSESDRDEGRGPGVRRRALDYLQRHNVMTLATVGEDGPWAASVFYVNDGFDLYWISSPNARHSRHIAARPWAAVTVHEEYSGWQAIQGIQMEGEVHMCGTVEENPAFRRLYGNKFPFLGDFSSVPPPLAAALAKVRVYRLTPRLAYFIDNPRGFGSRAEIPL